ncbi:MAG: peptidoglycan DL-endopeptidase RipA [Frankiaceae bacterium]|jgi:cell wall-associated NlpC family hydrolase|nr:peptidoglycan DL-endopeptidase RipA [Frankiaceae bacterium]
MRARAGFRAGAAAVLAGCALLTTAPPAAASHGGPGGPTAAQVQASKDRVARLERQVRAASAAVASSQAALDQLTTDAEVAVEAYNRAVIVATAAQQRLDADQVVLDTAAARVRTVRHKVGAYAADAYRGADLANLDALFSSDGPQSLLDRLSGLDAVARAQRAVLQDLAAAQVYQHGVQQQAAAIAKQATDAANGAARARDRAQQQVAAQTAAVANLQQAQQHLADVLTHARAHATALERARLAALARARQEAAARRAAAAAAAALRQKTIHPGGSGSSSYFNTVSAGTEQAALNYAESQIGKPYEWGAAGPNSYDCSGLVMWAYAKVGVTVDHWTGFQWNEGAHIALSDLRAGDLVFFATNTNDPNTIHHVGMYIGNGQMVEAPYTGANVRISNAFRDDLIGAVRLYQH